MRGKDSRIADSEGGALVETALQTQTTAFDCALTENFPVGNSKLLRKNGENSQNAFLFGKMCAATFIKD